MAGRASPSWAENHAEGLAPLHCSGFPASPPSPTQKAEAGEAPASLALRAAGLVATTLTLSGPLHAPGRPGSVRRSLLRAGPQYLAARF